ncbi:HpcH/HpaI aldolase/citrate lyase family protein [Nocardioides sp. J9]|uniref:HpcH/HpaI aldolase family protein n=1 Tax=Nocardioides sp. J9 TaxID=935844 RepID=UPI0016474E7E|nr:aldolase/citrate lyase family protein [Nocardioides sp. J9]
MTERSRSTVVAYAAAGFDFVCLDCQHSELDETRAAELLRSDPAPQTPVMVRVSDNRQALIGRVLDAGAVGVIVPDIDDASDAERAVAATRYPPAGQRSFGPTRDDLPRDPRLLEDRVVCLVMIETARALANLDDICRVSGLAGVLVGPGDLSISCGLAPERAFSSGQLDDVMARIAAACVENDLIFGAYATDVASAARWRAHGCDLIPVGSGTRLLRSAASDLNHVLRRSN